LAVIFPKGGIVRAEEIRQDLQVEKLKEGRLRIIGPTYIDFVVYGLSSGGTSWGNGHMTWEGEVPAGSGVLVLSSGARVASINHMGKIG